MYQLNYLLKIVLLILPILIVAQDDNPNYTSKLDVDVQITLNFGYVVTGFITFTSAEDVLKEAKSNNLKVGNLTRRGGAHFVKQRLIRHAEATQSNVVNIIKEHQVNDTYLKFESLWVSNRIYIEGLTKKLALKIVDEEHLKFIEKPGYNLNLLQANAANVTNHFDNENFTWGLQKIEVEKTWTKLFQTPADAGKGVIVGVMDTGFSIDQPLINGSILEDYYWYDPSNTSLDKPIDWSGHGTHVTGTIVGKNGIGVAPGAKFTSCRACTSYYGCQRLHIERCAQFFMCPTKPDGSDENCENVVDVVNISFGTTEIKNWFEAIVNAFHANDIVTVVAAGNGQRYCKSLWYPATIENVITVGSSNTNDESSWFSSWGPVEGKVYYKPDVVAPGSNVKSAALPKHGQYWAMSGTSSAAAHVTGLVALMRSKFRHIVFSHIRNIIKNNADNSHPVWSWKCNGTSDADVPSYIYGAGRINAFKALSSALGVYEKTEAAPSK